MGELPPHRPVVLVVLPVLDANLGHRCLDSMGAYMQACTIVVDNGDPPLDYLASRGAAVYEYQRPGANIGVAASWNHGRRLALQCPTARWLVLLSEVVVFGEHGGADLLDGVVDQGPLGAIDAPGVSVAEAGWKCTALRTSTLDRVGEFDEGFWPAYYEDTDYLYRMGLAGLASPRENGKAWPMLHVDMTIPEGDAHALRSGLVDVDLDRLAARYRAKWGGNQGEERHRTPWGLNERNGT